MTTLPTLQDADLALDHRVATLTMQCSVTMCETPLTGTHLIDDIVRAVEWANAEPAVSVLVLTGAGSAFSAGGNVKDMANRGGDFAGDVAEVESATGAGFSAFHWRARPRFPSSPRSTVRPSALASIWLACAICALVRRAPCSARLLIWGSFR